MSSDIMDDRISVLPQDIKDSILARLKIKEAARTCVLSRSWRYQWHSLSKINIDFADFDEVSKEDLVKIINHIFLFHRGSVGKLKLVLDLDAQNEIDQWILYVSRNGIRELDIQIRTYELIYNIPSCIFSCSDLTCLELSNCSVGPPGTFKEFGNLTKLAFNDYVIDSKALENVIESCPLLSQLSLEAPFDPAPTLKINAPKLVLLRMTGFYHFPRLMNTPLLDYADLALEYCRTTANEDCKIIELLESMPILQRLELAVNALRHLAVGDVPACLPFICPIKRLTMFINFEDLRDSRVAVCIVRSSPFLQHLKMERFTSNDEARISSVGFWEEEHGFSFELSNLRTLKLNWLSGNECELKVIKFILSKAPALTTLKVRFREGAEGKPWMVTELLQCTRTSPNARLVFPSNWSG